MDKLKERSLACLLAVVLAFSMVSATALTAFANQFAPGTMAAQSDDIVYDTAYGVMHGEYALMMKSITYEAEYKGSVQEFTGQIVDLVKANGSGPGIVQVHTSTAPDVAGVPGEYTALRSTTSGQDIISGYMQVTNKETGKSGVVNLDGSVLVPCEYDRVQLHGKGFVGLTIGTTSVTAAFLGKDGAKLGSTTFTVPESDAGRYVYLQTFGDYLSVVMSVGTESFGSCVRWDGQKYVEEPNIVSIYSTKSTEPGDGFVYAAADGYLYYHPSTGADVKLESAENVTSCSVRHSLLELAFKEDSSSYKTTHSYYNTSGQKLDFGDASIAVVMADGVITYRNDGGVYAVYDYSGTQLRTIDAPRVFALDATHYGATTEKDESTYLLAAYNFDGTLVKEITTVDSSYSWLRPVYVSGDDDAYSIVGYESSWTNENNESVYFDTSFNATSVNPRSASIAKPLALADGTVVNASVTGGWDSTGTNYVYTASVTDSSGNPVKRGDCTLDIATDTGGYLAVWNSVKHGNADVWWGADSNGKWGAVSSDGTVVVPFKFESYYDGGCTDTQYAMVKENGVWRFLSVGSAMVEPDEPVAPLESVTRLDGEDRYQTMAKIVNEGFKSSEYAVVATGTNFPDALAANALAGAYKCPVILTKSDALSPEASQLLKTLGVKTAFVMGGKVAVSEKAFNDIKALGVDAQRVAGDTRQDTALAAMDRVKDRTGSVDTVIVATGAGFADTLSVGPYSYAKAAPIVLTGSDGKLSKEALTKIKELSPKLIVAVGGVAVVHKDVEKQLSGITFDRLGGDDRYATCKKVVNWELKNGLSLSCPGVATGTNFPDALAASALCGSKGSVMVLASESNSSALAELGDAKGAYVFGGKSAVPAAVETATRKVVG